MVFIQGGCYQMGSPSNEEGRDSDEKQHRVCVDDFRMAQHEVTVGQWQAVMGSNPSRFKNGDNYPVEQVSWDDVMDFIDKLNRKTGQNYRLPTEAEWEYAARAGSTSRYYWGNSPSGRHANADEADGWPDDGYKKNSAPVGSYIANDFGLYDMLVPHQRNNR
ncbi:MAG: formylglycine-generating enzyme family protein [Gammaproteobacteria bacterium]|nr:formylglycine-generating enzyme family protein [Gammaproteobacteria bacterium]